MNKQPAFMVLRLSWGLALALSLALARVTPASAALRCYVKAGATGSNTGASWANAYINLQSALGGSPCTEVWVAKGIYKPTAGMDRTVSFVLKNGVALYGGFAGTETLLSQRNPSANPTILSGNIGDLGTTSDNSFHVVLGSGRNATARLDGFTVTAGNANGTGLDQYGGGIHNDSGSPTLVNLTLSANSAEYGGGVFGESASPNLINVTFSVNTATSFGGGMLNSAGSNPSLKNVIFSSNEAAQGGGMWNSASSPTLVNVVFSGNSGNSGGGMHNDFVDTVSLTNVTFSGNSAVVGGGMYSLNSSLNLTGVAFTGNTATNGGGMNNDWSTASLENVTFAGNSAGNLGGGIYNSQSSPNLTNVTLSGNSGALGGGGMHNEQSSNPVVTNSIFYGDTGGEITSNSSSPAVTFSIVQGGFPGAGNLSANPMLKPLGSYGGSTKTMPLSYGSPAIDHGTNSGCPATDQRGIVRPQDGDRNGTATCDMGATESRLLIKTFQSIGAQDGWVLESSETSGIGGSSMNSTDPTLIVGDAITRQQGRSILSFNTSSLPDTVQLVSGVLKVRQAQISPTSPFTVLGNLLVDVRKGPFSNNAALQASDFQAPASKNAAITILNNPINGWYSRPVPAAHLVYINKVGLTQFRLRFTLDDNNDSVSNYIRFYSGNAATLSVRPVLIVRYYLP